MTFLVDIDSCINNFSEVMLSYLNAHHSTSYQYSDITHWDWFKDTFGDNWFFPMNSNCFWDDVTIYPNAVHCLESLVKNGHKVYLVTASYPSDTLGYKLRKTLEAFNPELINYHNVIVAYDKEMIKGDVLIDDKLENINLAHENGLITFIASQPWNQDKEKCLLVADKSKCLNDRWAELEEYLNFRFN